MFSNLYVFGTLIDSILTTFTYMQRSIVDKGMKKGIVSVDIQLYVVTKQVCWIQHIIQSFLGCNETQMKGSALEVYATAAYEGINGILGERYEGIS